MSDKLVEALKRLEVHADALMRVPANEQGIAGIQAVTSIAILDAKRALEELARLVEERTRPL